MAEGETDLKTLLGSMRPELQPDILVFVTTPPEQRLPDGTDPVMAFREREGRTLILVPQPRSKAVPLTG